MSYTEEEYFNSLKRLLNANQALSLRKATFQGMFYLGEDYLDSYLRDYNRMRSLYGMSTISERDLPTEAYYTSWYISFSIK